MIERNKKKQFQYLMPSKKCFRLTHFNEMSFSYLKQKRTTNQMLFPKRKKNQWYYSELQTTNVKGLSLSERLSSEKNAENGVLISFKS